MAKDETIRQVPIESVSDPQYPVRTVYDEHALNGLANSIRDLGVINPLVVFARDKGYEVIAGHRRLAAARMAGLSVVPVVVRDVSGLDLGALRLHENLNREDLNPVDEGRYFADLVAQYNVSVDELANELRRSPKYVKRRMATLEWDSAIQQAVSEKKIPYSAAYWLAKIEPEPKRRDYLKYAISGGITAPMAKSWYNASKKDRLPSEPSEKALESIPKPERKDYYRVPCEICGEPIPSEEQGVFMAHEKCVEQVKEAVAEAKERE